jgi:hypothetical protein
LFEARSTSLPFEHEGWIIIASVEKELYGEDFKPKKIRGSSLVLTFGREPKADGEFYGSYLFRANVYTEDLITEAPFDQPIYKLVIADTLEHSCLVYVSPYVVRELGLRIDSALHRGFLARNDKGEVIIKMATWKEDYIGSISDGTEVSRLEGVGVMVRSDYYESLLGLYQNEGWFVLYQDTSDE